MRKYKQLFMQSQLQMEGLINRFNESNFNPFKASANDYRQYLHTQDRIVASNRYIWNFNECTNLTSAQYECMLYGKGAMLWVEENGQLIFTDFAETGDLQAYGRLERELPIKLNGETMTERQGVILRSGEKANSAAAVIMRDYTDDYGGGIVPRETLNDVLIRDESNVYKQLMNNIMVSIKKAIASCENVDQLNAVMSQIEIMLDPDTPILPILSNKGAATAPPVSMYNFSNNFDTQNYCQQIEFYAKKRRQDMGIPTPDTFEKKERKITDESSNANMYSGLILLDGYTNRITALNLAKKYLKIDGIDGVTVQINPILIETSEDNSNDDRAI